MYIGRIVVSLALYRLLCGTHLTVGTGLYPHIMYSLLHVAKALVVDGAPEHVLLVAWLHSGDGNESCPD